MKKLARQDRNGTRTSEELRRRYKLNEIELTADEVEYLKQFIEVDSFLSTSSIHPVQNKVITEALNSKVNKETGKGLSTNDFTTTLLEKLNKIQANAEANIIESVSVNGVTQTITNKNVDLQIKDGHTHDNKTILDGITAEDITAWNNLVVYENGGTTDANTTTERLILTKVNSPNANFWYIETLFYSSISNTSNRKQIAYGYKFDAPIYTRYYNNGAWSEWKPSDVISSSIEDNEGYIWYANGTLEQWGRVSITPTAANTVTSLNIVFPKAYDKVPDIDAIPQANTPNAITWSVGGGSTTDEAKQGMIIYATRTNTSATLFKWKAKGFKNPF